MRDVHLSLLEKRDVLGDVCYPLVRCMFRIREEPFGPIPLGCGVVLFVLLYELQDGGTAAVVEDGCFVGDIHEFVPEPVVEKVRL